LKETLSRLEVLRPLLQRAYELRAAEAREQKRRLDEIAEKQRQDQLRAAEEAAQMAEEARKAAAAQAALDAVAEDSEEDELVARARKLRLTNSNPKPESLESSAKPQSDELDSGSDVSDSELPALSPEELREFEKELESQAEEPSPETTAKDASPILVVPSPQLDEIFSSGKYIGGLDAIGNSAIAKPDGANVVAPGYAITATPFTDGVLQPDVLENHPPLIDLSATMRGQPLMMAPQHQQFAMVGTPAPATPNLMDLSTIPNPSQHSKDQSKSAASPLLSFAPPPVVVPASAPPLEVAPPAVLPAPSPSVAPITTPVSIPINVVPSAPTETVVAQPAKIQAAQVRHAPSSGDALVMERPKKKTETVVEAVPEIEAPSAPPMELDQIPATSKRSERMGEIPAIPQQKQSPSVPKKVSFDEKPAEAAVAPKKVQSTSTQWFLFASDRLLSYSEQQKSSKKSKGSSGAPSSSSSSRKYNVTAGVAEPDPSDQDPMMSITKTYRNKQYNPREDASMRPRLDAAPTGPTCTNDTPSTSSPGPSSRSVSPQPMPMVMVPSHGHAHHGHGHNHGHNHGIQYGRPMPGQPFYVPPASQPQYVQMANQQVPVVYSPFQNPQVFQNAQQIVYQPQQGHSTSSAVMPVMYGVPVAFRPQMLSIYGQTNKTQGALATAAPPKSAEASAPPLLHSKDLEESSDSSEEDEPAPSKKGKKSGTKSKPAPIPKPALKKKAPKLIDGLRQIDVDGEIFDSFMRSAHGNTSREIETCGILCGRMNDDESGFSVTHLIIPKQTATTDTCATTDEEEIFLYQMKKDLLTLGWIHTHPTQACFLSSVDLHTQASYQGLFPEALAVVIAPRDQPNFSIFHLTSHGLMSVQACPLKGFHLHDEIRLYEPTTHVQLRWGQKKYKVVDMR
jgi:proteasome lid subunit RPN8/RPN11